MNQDRWFGTIVNCNDLISPHELRQLHRHLRGLQKTRGLHPDEVRFREELEELERRLGHTLYTEANRRERGAWATGA